MKVQQKIEVNLKILLVSDLEHFATRNVFEGYVQAFRMKGISVTTFKMYDLLAYYSPNIIHALLLANICNVQNSYTHVLFVTGTNVPPHVTQSIPPHIKVGIIGTDDPHSTQIVCNNFGEKIDWYFVNEKKLHQYNQKFHYLPIGSTSTIPTKIEPKHISDICFIGTVYPSRYPYIERLVKWAKENDKIVKIIGPYNEHPTDPDVLMASDQLLMNNTEAMKYIMGAKVSVNLDRDVNWAMFQAKGNNPGAISVGDPYSTNPRTYEIALCKSIQLFINPRQEAVDLFGDSIYTANDKNLEQTLTTIFETPKPELESKRARCFDIARYHTYEARVGQLINMLM